MRMMVVMVVMVVVSLRSEHRTCERHHKQHCRKLLDHGVHPTTGLIAG